MKTHYEILGIDESATLEQIKEAFRKLALQCHPDALHQQQHLNNQK